MLRFLEVNRRSELSLGDHHKVPLEVITDVLYLLGGHDICFASWRVIPDVLCPLKVTTYVHFPVDVIADVLSL